MAPLVLQHVRTHTHTGTRVHTMWWASNEAHCTVHVLKLEFGKERWCELKPGLITLTDPNLERQSSYWYATNATKNESIAVQAVTNANRKHGSLFLHKFIEAKQFFYFFYFFCIGITAFRSSLKSAVTNKGNSCDCRGTSVGLNSSNYPHQDCPRHICTRKILMCSYIVEETFSLHVLDSMLLIYSVVC